MKDKFIVCILDKTTNYSSILELTSNNFTDGWSPKFDYDEGFYDPWFYDIRKEELKILNDCYDNWSVEKTSGLFNELNFRIQ